MQLLATFATFIFMSHKNKYSTPVILPGKKHLGSNIKLEIVETLASGRLEWFGRTGTFAFVNYVRQYPQPH